MLIQKKLQQNVPLAPYTTFHIGGPADYFVIVQTSEELIEAVLYAKKNNINFFLLGQGANILVGDKGFRGLVIKNEANKINLLEKEEILLTAESGNTIAELINYTVERGLSGLEHFTGIPSSLGGALWQNLHFLSSNRSTTVFIGDMVQGAVIVTESGNIKEVNQDYFQFAYDYSILHDTCDVVVSATLQLHKEDKDNIVKTANANISWRNEKHPKDAGKKSAGSVFKKLEGHGAGRLIEQVGLKGIQIGGAQISEKHANFIVNTGGATAKDVRDIINIVQYTVKEKLGLELQTEISFIGEFS